MTNRMKLLTAFLVAGILLVGAGTWFLLNPVQGIQVADSAPITIKLPDTPAIISEKLEFIMQAC